MEKEHIEVDYDQEHDIISLFRKGNKSKFSFNIELPKGDLVVDYGFDGSVVGLEIFNASHYLPFLKKIRYPAKLTGELTAQYGKNWVEIYYGVSTPEIKQTISNSIISPYNKKIVIER